MRGHRSGSDGRGMRGNARLDGSSEDIHRGRGRGHDGDGPLPDIRLPGRLAAAPLAPGRRPVVSPRVGGSHLLGSHAH